MASVFGFYLATLAPSLNWADGARMQLDVMFGGSTYWSFEEAAQVPTDGLPFDRLGAAAWDHPLYVMLAQVFLALPFGEPLFRINLVSAAFGALAIGVVYQIGQMLIGTPGNAHGAWVSTSSTGGGSLDSMNRAWIAGLGAVSLAVAHTFWFHAVTSEAYTLNLFFMGIVLWIALRWAVHRRWQELAVGAFAAGLGLANHVMLAITVLIAGIYVMATTYQSKGGFRQFGSKRLAILAGLFALGFAPWWIQFLRMARIIGWPLSIQIAAGYPWLGNRMDFSSVGTVLVNVLGYGGWLVLQFMPWGAALGLYGFWKMWCSKPGVARFLLALLAAHVLFSANYRLADQFDFHLPSYLIFSLGITYGLAQAWQATQRRLALTSLGRKIGLWNAGLLVAVIPVGVYALAPAGMRAAGFAEERLGIPPIGAGARDALEYFINPNSHGDDSAARFARTTMAQLAPNALVFTPKSSDQETYVVLRYVQLIEGKRPDVRIELMLFDPVDDMAQAILEQTRLLGDCRPIYLASLNPRTFPLEALREQYDIQSEANLYRLVARQKSSQPGTCPDLSERWAGVTLNQLIQLAMRRQ